MNKVIMLGRLTRENAVSGEENSKVVRNTIAVQRSFKNKDGNYETDFIPIVAWGKTGEFLEKHFKKGDAIVIDGSMRSGSYEKDGKTIYTLECHVNNIEFSLSRKTDENANSDSEKSDDNNDGNPFTTSDETAPQTDAGTSGTSGDDIFTGGMDQFNDLFN